MRLAGQAPGGIGSPVTFDLGGSRISGSIVRKTADDFAIRADDNLEARAAMVQHVYSGHNRAAAAKVKPTGLIERLVIRLFA